MSLIAFVPVRGGSKSIPLKNIRSLAGRPLVWWTLKSLQDCADINQIVVATDSSEIKSIVQSFKLSKVSIYDRDAVNAQDTSSTESVMLEYLDKNSQISDDSLFILSQATSPLTDSSDYSKALELFKSQSLDSLVTGTRTKRFFWKKDQPLNYDPMKRPRRQDFEGLIQENGAFYISKVSGLRKNKNRLFGKIGVYEMAEHHDVEIDDPEDWDILERRICRYKSKILLPETKIKLFLSDIDGVLTDGGMYYSENGDETKKFHVYDGMGFEILREQKIPVGFVTSESRELNARRAAKLKIDHYYPGEKEKLNRVTELCDKLKISLSEVAYIGDDRNDFDVMSAVGFKACPSSAQAVIKEIPGIIQLKTPGGHGAVREWIQFLQMNGRI